VVAIQKTPGAFISGPFMPRETKGHGERQGVGEVIQHRDHLPPESSRANTPQRPYPGDARRQHRGPRATF
jgi:hypothetical protein